MPESSQDTTAVDEIWYTITTQDHNDSHMIKY